MFALLIVRFSSVFLNVIAWECDLPVIPREEKLQKLIAPATKTTLVLRCIAITIAHVLRMGLCFCNTLHTCIGTRIPARCGRGMDWCHELTDVPDAAFSIAKLVTHLLTTLNELLPLRKQIVMYATSIITPLCCFTNLLLATFPHAEVVRFNTNPRRWNLHRFFRRYITYNLLSATINPRHSLLNSRHFHMHRNSGAYGNLSYLL